MIKLYLLTFLIFIFLVFFLVQTNGAIVRRGALDCERGIEADWFFPLSIDKASRTRRRTKESILLEVENEMKSYGVTPSILRHVQFRGLHRLL